MRIATEAITDPFGGLYWHTARIKKFSTHIISEFPTKPVRIFLDRSRRLKEYYKSNLQKIRGFDIVHSRSDPWFIRLCERSRSKSCAWVNTFHTLFFKEHYSAGLEPWQEDINEALLNVARHADIKISVSKWGAEFLEKEHNIKTVVIENGADFDMCNTAIAARFEKKFGFKDFILFVGSFREVKDPAQFIHLAQRMPKTIFLMIGDGINKERLRSKYQINIPDNCKLLGRMAHGDVLDAMAACKIFMMTSKSEGLPNCLLEAMALGKTVVVPRHTGCQELVHSSEYGFMYECTDSDDLYDKTQIALEAKGVGERAKVRIREKYDWKTSARKLDELYNSWKVHQ